MTWKPLRLWPLLALGAALLPVPPAALGEVCGLDDNPAATLLLPYFEVDLARADGPTTMFSLNNASDLAVLTQVTLWSDLGVPTLAFHVYLTGYDIQTVNLRDVFNGQLPHTASHGQDPLDDISPQGERSQDINFASCNGVLPGTGTLPAGVVDHLRAAHTGRFSALLNGCAGQNLGDGVERGYVTIDTVSRCDSLFPSSPGYFGPGGVATNQNLLWGDYYLIDPADNFASGENLVRLEADPSYFRPGDVTFYGRYVGYDARDAREPLSRLWANRFVTGGAFSGGTDLVVWRDAGTRTAAFSCLTRPSWYPLDLDAFDFFDEEETADGFFYFPGSPPLPPPYFPFFPAESNRVKLGTSAIPLPFDFGFAVIDFGQDLAERPPAQVYVSTLMSADGRFQVSFGATPMAEACRRRNPFSGSLAGSSPGRLSAHPSSPSGR